MAGTVMPPPGAGLTVGMGQRMSASLANSYGVAAMAGRLAVYLRTGNDGNPNELCSLCLSLARGIDYAVANNEIPTNVEELPCLLKQICERKNGLLLQVAIMVLMISVKDACKIGWFSGDCEELFDLANKIGNSFCSQGDANSGSSNSFSLIQTVMSRFYPLMKIGQILGSIEVKPGYGVYVMDFHLSKNSWQSPQDKMCLLVVQVDNTETSACIISPQQVNFLLNGKGVARRTNVEMDTGPQIPSNVTRMLKLGTNLLQAVGQFNGHYIIVVAFMSMMPIPETPMVQDYIQSGVPVLDPDSDIIEGPSRISLNCPISCKRIRIPVKGQSCKHHQCFDFRNYVEINLRRPSWRCPHCNQSCCYTDIRIDQNIVKVLCEVGENVIDVIISADGSWKAVLESNANVDQIHEKTLNEEQPEQQELPASTAAHTVLDLTEDDDKMDLIASGDVEDRKPSQSNIQSQAVATNLMVPSHLNNADDVIQYASSQMGDDLWSNILLDSGSLAPGPRAGVPSVSAATPASIVSPVITDTISPSLDFDVGINGNIDLTSAMQNQIPAFANWQLQQPPPPVNSAVNPDHGRMVQLPRQISRTPIGVQALPAQFQAPNLQQRPRTNLHPVISGGDSRVSQGTISTGPSANGQQQLSRSHLNLHQQPRSHIPGQSIHQQFAGLYTPNQHPGAATVSSGLANGSYNSTWQQALWVPLSGSLASGATQSSSSLPHFQTQHGGAPVGVGIAAGSQNSQRAGYIVSTSQRPTQMARQPPFVPVQTSGAGTSSYPASAGVVGTSTTEHRGSVGGAVQSAPGTDGLGNFPSEQNWRPMGRMRGSLTCRAFENLGDLMIQPTQASQVARQRLNLSSWQPSAPPHLQASLTSSQPSVHPSLQAFLNSTSQVPWAQNSPTTGPARSNGISGSLP